jgi:hypothetical protein
MKVKVGVALFSYSGNGGIASTIPEIALWLAKTYYQMKTDPRIEYVGIETYCDTPITMTRNKAVEDAQNAGMDLLLMLDSDNEPDGYLKRYPQEVKPFWPTAFGFAYERLTHGEPTVIAAPYCGPPPHPVGRDGIIDHGEVPYLFEWGNRESDNPHCDFKLNLMTRNEAAKLAGIYPVAALPTGVCLFTLNAFEGLPHPYFAYEFNERQSEKKSTEDVVTTRDISLFWKMTKGLDVCYAACDSWALHHKTKKVGRPQFVAVEALSSRFVDAIANHQTYTDEKRHVEYDIEKLPRRGRTLLPHEDAIYLSDEDLRAAKELAVLEGYDAA